MGCIRKRASGRYQASYIGPDMKRHFAPTTFELKMDARNGLARERRGLATALSALKGSNNNTAALKLEWMSPSERPATAGDISRETLDEYGKRWISQRDLKPRSLLHYEADTGEIHFLQAGHNQHAELEACDDCAGVPRSNPGGQTDSYCTRSALLRSTMHC